MRIVVYLFAALWLVAVAASVLALNVAPTGDGFVRGLNRVEGFLTWQFAALGAAVVAAIALRFARQPRATGLAIVGYGPAALSALLFLVLAGIVAWAAFAPQPPAAAPDIPGPVTEAPS